MLPSRDVKYFIHLLGLEKIASMIRRVTTSFAVAYHGYFWKEGSESKKHVFFPVQAMTFFFYFLIESKQSRAVNSIYMSDSYTRSNDLIDDGQVLLTLKCFDILRCARKTIFLSAPINMAVTCDKCPNPAF